MFSTWLFNSALTKTILLPLYIQLCNIATRKDTNFSKHATLNIFIGLHDQNSTQHLISVSLFLRFPFSWFHSVFCSPWGQLPQLVLSGCCSSDPLGGAVEWQLGYYCLHCSDHTSLSASPRPPVGAGRHKCHTQIKKDKNGKQDMIFSTLGLGVNHCVTCLHLDGKKWIWL